VDRETRRTMMQLAYASSIGIAMAVAIFGCFFLGNWLDKRLGTEPYFALGLLIVGIAAGFRNMYVLIKRNMKDMKNAGPITAQEDREQNGKKTPAQKA
jgi:ATP synthase protein I